jgi:iron complex outermembrane receptor protein
MQNYLRQPFRSAIFVATAVFGMPSTRAEPTLEPEKQEIVRLERFVVTGSHLASSQGAPVTVIGLEDIARSGVSTNVLDVLRKQMPAFSGSGNLGANNASTGATSTYGGSRLALHNMPTLVLLNGRRVATSGANARGGSSFIDVNQFPLAAIERIEVVTSGASAVYGSDAIGGVVNIILKPSYNGSEVGGQYAFSTRDGDYSEKSAYFTAGASTGRLGVIVTGSYSKSSPLMQTDRPFSNFAASTSYSGVVAQTIGTITTSYYLNQAVNSPSEQVPVGPAATAPGMSGLVGSGLYTQSTTANPTPGLNLAGDVTLLTEQEKRSGYIGLNLKLIDRRLEAFGDVLYSKSKSFSQLGAQFATFNGTGSNPQQIAAGTPYNPTTTNLAPSFRYIPAPRRYSNDATLLRFATGLRGEITPTWNWEAAYTYSRNKLVTQISNVLYTPNLDLAVLGGYDQNGNVVAGGRYSRVYANYATPLVPPSYNTTALAAGWLATQRNASNTVLQPALDPFARSTGTDPASIANVLGTSHADFKSGLQSLDLVVRGNLFELPAGDIAVAVGGDHRVEKLQGVPDENSRSSGPTGQRWSGGTFFDAFDQDRDVNAGFLELLVPVSSPRWNLDIVHALDLTLAYRVEHYSDAGSSSSPRYGVRWQPVSEDVTVRYSYSKAFGAPTLFQMFGTQQGLTNDLRTLFGLPAGPWLATLRQTPSKSMQPTLARTQSVGVVFSPKALKGLIVSFDYTDAYLKNLVGRLGPSVILQSVDQLGAASPYVSQVGLYNFPGEPGAQTVTTPGQIKSFLQANPANTTASILYVNDPAMNLTSAKLRALDVSANYTWSTERRSTFKFGATGTFFLADKIQSLPSDPYYDYARQMTSAEGTMPAYRFYTQLEWRTAAWEASLGNTYIPPVEDTGAGGSVFANSSSLRRIRLASFLSWDVSLAYTLSFNKTGDGKRVLQLKTGINNVTDEMPPVSSQAFVGPNSPGADTSTYGLIGRLYYVSASVRF